MDGAGGSRIRGAAGLHEEGAPGTAGAEVAWRESGDGAKWAECLDDCDMASELVVR